MEGNASRGEVEAFIAKSGAAVVSDIENPYGG
jgi:hypothetical protein